MRISLNWLQEWLCSPHKTTEEIKTLLTQRGLEVESIEVLSQGWENVICAFVESTKPHPQADRLKICQVNDGKETLQIVCGAPNVQAGQKVVLAQIGARLAHGLHIKESVIRSEKSFGMLCSAEELGLPPSEGIIVLNPETPIGTPAAALFYQDDTILTFKITPNRADCFSHKGIARELSSAWNTPLQMPAIQKKDIAVDPELKISPFCKKYFLAKKNAVVIQPSSEKIQNRLLQLGITPINNVIDLTHLFLLETGIPVHAYDARHLNQEISVRLAKKQEPFFSLEEKMLSLEETDLVISHNDEVLCLAGVMGGKKSAVQNDTTCIILEMGCFDPILIRKSSTRLGLKTLAAHRFERGIDEAQLENDFLRLLTLFEEHGIGSFVWAKKSTQQSRSCTHILIHLNHISKFLGLPAETEVHYIPILKSLSFECTPQDDLWDIKVPSFRADISCMQDLADEIIRCLGFDMLPNTTAAFSQPPTLNLAQSLHLKDHFLEKNRLKQAFKATGFCETIQFAFTSQALLSQLGFHSDLSLLNPLSQQQAVLIPSLIPGLIQGLFENLSHRFGSEIPSIRLFEIRPVFKKTDTLISANTTHVQEELMLSGVCYGPKESCSLQNEQKNTDFYDFKGILAAAFEYAQLPSFELKAMQTEEKCFFAAQSAEIFLRGKKIGKMGRLHPQIAQDFKLKAACFIFEINAQSLFFDTKKHFRSWSAFPGMQRDFALIVDETVDCKSLCHCALKAGAPLAQQVRIFDRYQSEQLGKGKMSIGIRVDFAQENQSLTEEQTTQASKNICAALEKTWGAELRTF